jgi:catechol 2,3-dioxygenase-like lactoylglutathione lyase family enzyme
MLPVSFLAAAAAFLSAQTAAPNATGISFGHMHLYVADAPATEKVLTDVLSGTVVNFGTLKAIKTPGAYIVVGSRAKSDGGSKGSAIDHIGYSVKNYADTIAKAKAAGLAVQELGREGAGQSFVTLPGDVILELAEDANIAAPAVFTHYHMMATDQDGLREWYLKTFGATVGERRKGLKGAMIPGGIVDFLANGGKGKAPAPLAPSKGRTLDHVGFEVKDLKSFIEKLKADGIKMDRDYEDLSGKIGLKIAFITDPNGGYIELTEGLNKQ